MKILFVVLSFVSLIGCSNDHSVTVEQTGKIDVEKIRLNDENLLTVDQYLIDDRSRMTVLIQCDQFFSDTTKKIPLHCINAKEAEEKAVVLDVIAQMEKEKGRPLTDDEIKELNGSIHAI